MHTRLFRTALLSRLALGMCILPLAAVAVPNVAHAANWVDQGAFGASPELLRKAAAAAERHAEDDAGVVVLHSEVNYSYDDNGLETTTIWRTYLVRDDSAVHGWGNIQVSWSPWQQASPTIEARVISVDGAEHLLTEDLLSESAAGASDNTMYDDQRILRGPLPNMAVGVIVEERIVRQQITSIMGGGAARQFWLATGSPTESLRVTVEVPADSPLRFALKNDRHAVRKWSSKTRKGIALTVQRPQTGFTEAPLLDPADTSIPHLVFSTAPEWDVIGALYSSAIASQLDSAGLQSLIDEVQAQNPTRREIVQRAYAIARDRLRYTGLEFGEQAVIPHTPAESVGRGFGDCKDKAALLVTLLAQADIDAHLALLNSDSAYGDVDPNFPGTTSFNHAIVYVPEFKLWLDPTATMSSVDDLSWAIQGQHALVINGVDSALLQIPSARGDQHTYVERRAVSFAVRGKPTITETTTGEGWPGAELRWDFMDAAADAIEENLIKYGADTYQSPTLAAWELSPVDDVNTPVVLVNEHAQAGVGLAKMSGAELYVNPTSIARFAPIELSSLPEEDDWLEGRTKNIVFVPFSAELSYRIDIPDGFVLVDPPVSEVHAYGDGHLSLTVSRSGQGDIDLVWQLEDQDGVMTPSDASALRTDLMALVDAGSLHLQWDQMGAQLLSMGKRTEAFDYYRERIAADPDEFAWPLWYSEALLGASLRAPAERVLNDFVSAHPETQLGWSQLSYVRMHNDFGVEDLGHSRTEALDAARRAHKIDPSDLASRHIIGVLSVVGDSGVSLGTGSDIDQAIEQMGYMVEMGDTSVVSDLVELLFLEERYKEVGPLLGEDSSNDAHAARFAVMAVLKDTPRAVAALGRADLAAGDQFAVLQGASKLTMMARQYSVTAEIQRVLAPLSADPIGMANNADVVDGITRETRADKSSPAAPMFAMFTAVSFGLDVGAIIEQFTSSDASRTAIVKELQLPAQMQGAIDELGLSPEGMGDLIRATTSVALFGTAKIGHRLVITTADKPVPVNVYVVKERGKWLVRALGQNAADELAFEAWNRAKRGDTVGAAQWLTWSLEELAVLDNQRFKRFEPVIPTEMTAADVLKISALVALNDHGEVADDVVAWRDDADTSSDEVTALVLALLNGAYCTRNHGLVLALLEEYPDAVGEEYALWLETAAHADAKNWDAAIASATKLQEFSPGRDQLSLNAILRSAGKHQEANVALRQMIEEQGGTPFRYNNLAWALLFEGDIDAALEYAMMATAEQKSTNISELHTLAVVKLHAGDLTGAEQALKAAIVHPGGNLTLDDHWRLVMGGIAQGHGLTQDAEAYYAGIAAKPGHSSATVADMWRAAVAEADGLTDGL